MGLKINKGNDYSTIKHSEGHISEEFGIANLVSKLNNPVTHKCKTTLRYMYAFFLDLLRDVACFEEFIAKIIDLKLIVSILDTLESTNIELIKSRQQCLECITLTYSDEVYPALLS